MIKTTYLVKCDHCGRVSHYHSRVNFGEYMYNICSNQCYEKAQANYEKNKNIVLVQQEEEGRTYGTDEI